MLLLVLMIYFQVYQNQNYLIKHLMILIPKLIYFQAKNYMYITFELIFLLIYNKD